MRAALIAVAVGQVLLSGPAVGAQTGLAGTWTLDASGRGGRGNFAGYATRDDRTNGCANATRREEHADSACCAFAERKDTFAKHGKQRQDTAAESPCGFDQQESEDSRSILDVPNTFHSLSYTQNAAQREFLSFSFFALCYADAGD